MRSAAAWLQGLWGRRAHDVATAYRERLDPHGVHSRLVLADLAQICHATQSTIVPGDPQGTAFNEGKRAVWLHVQDVLRLSPDDIPEVENS